MKILFSVGLLLTASLAAVFLIPRNTSRAFARVSFGTADTQETIFACDQDYLLIFRNNDASEIPERYAFQDDKLAPGITIPPFRVGNCIYTVTECYQYQETEPSPRHSLMIHVTVQDGERQFKQYCDVVVFPKGESMDHTRFDGPLSVVPQAVNWVPIKKSFVIGGEPTDLRVVVGSFDETLGCWTVVESGANNVYHFPDDETPVATVEFPSEFPERPIIERFPMDEFC